MTREQMVWANRHDWFVRAELVNGEWVVTVYADGIGSEVCYFTNYRELRHWAGY